MKPEIILTRSVLRTYNGFPSLKSLHSRFLNQSAYRGSESTEIKPSDKKKEDDPIARMMHPTLKKKLPQREPFVKNLFNGKFDKALLEFPEVLPKERDELLNDMLVPIENFMKHEVDCSKIDKDAKIPPENIQAMKDLGLFGMEVPLQYGGLGLCSTEHARINEALGLESGIGVTVTTHQSAALKAISLYGTEEQKNKYLPLLVTGELTAAIAFVESSGGTDYQMLKTKAVLSNDKNNYILNGTKTWVTNGGIADIFVVIAKTFAPMEARLADDVHIALIVERNFGGVSSGEPIETHGVRGANITEVTFDNTSVPVRSSVLADHKSCLQMLATVLDSMRFSVASMCVGSLKSVMNETLNHLINQKQFGLPVTDFTMIKRKLTEMSTDLYALESMTYLTAGLTDTCENQDVSVENAILKVFATEKCLKHGAACMDLMGAEGQVTGGECERIVRDFNTLSSFSGSNGVVRQYITLAGLQYTAHAVQEDVTILRNPYMHPNEYFKYMWKMRRGEQGKFSLDMFLHEVLHPSMRASSDNLEYCIKKFQYAVIKYFARHAIDVMAPKNQIDNDRLATVAMDLYAMTAILSRSSRAYCIGLRYSEHEIQLCNKYCFDARKRIDQLLDVVLNGSFGDMDYVTSRIADHKIGLKQYAPVHCLTRVFW